MLLGTYHLQPLNSAQNWRSGGEIKEGHKIKVSHWKKRKQYKWDGSPPPRTQPRPGARLRPALQSPKLG